MNTQNNELNRVKAKIKALAAKTVEQGCSEHEAMSAMAAVGRLLAQYNLTMEEIDVRQAKCKTIYIKTGLQRRGVIDGCITALADLVDAKVWFSTKWNTEGPKWFKETPYAFFGTEQDLELVEYLYHVIDKAIINETGTFKKTADYAMAGRSRSATVSFGHGMSNRISARLNQLRRDIDAEVARAQEAANASVVPDAEKPARYQSKGTALVALKEQLVQEEFKQLGITLRSARSSKRANDAGAYYKGQAAGDKVNLSRPITGGSNPSGYLS